MSIESQQQGLIEGAVDHCRQTWSQVIKGDASLGQYFEAGTEALAGAAVAAATIAAIGKTGLAQRLTAISRVTSHLPNISIATAKEETPVLSPAAAKRISDAALKNALPRTELYRLKVGERFKMTPYSDDVFQFDRYSDRGVHYHNVDYPPPHYASQLINHDALVRTGPNLLSPRELRGQPTHIPNQLARDYAGKLSSSSGREMPLWQTGSLTKRELPIYQKLLEIPDEELAAGKLIADIGAGAKQEFARSVNGARVISVDPGLALTEEADLIRLDRRIPQAYRLEGRRSPHPLTIAAEGHRLPLADHSVDSAYASFSLPMYANKLEDIPAFLSEVKRIVKPGGTARIYPLENRNLATVERWIAENRVADHNALTYKPLPAPNFYRPGARYAYSGGDYVLLTLRF